MSFLVIGTDRFLLQIGDNTLGGSGPDAVPAAVLRDVPPAAVIAVVPGNTTTIRRVGDGVVSVDGALLDGTPLPLRHGARLQIGDTAFVYGDVRFTDRTAAHTAAPDVTPAPGLPDIAAPEPTADTGGRLTSVGSGAVYEIPAGGLRIGRDPSCHIVVSSNEASRDHAFIGPTLLGYMITDRSTNGVFVNGRRVKGAQLLAQRDLVRICYEELRFEADPANFELDAARISNEAAPAPTVEIARPAITVPAAPRKDPPTAELPSARLLLATLEVLNAGPMKGMRFRIERPSVQIGRGVHSDICLPDESVSGSHATLVQEGPIWKLLDLDSTNGSYVDGTRIDRDAEIRGPAELRFGNVKVLFRPIARGADVKRTRQII